MHYKSDCIENMKKKLLGKNLYELQDVVSSYGMPLYVAKQMADWLYKKKVRDIGDMTNLSKQFRERLSEDYEIGVTEYSAVYRSSDGTKKYVFPVTGGGSVETVMIPEPDRATLCVSSQNGCKMNCSFCMTGRGGFRGNLDAAEIMSQYIAVDEADMLTNTVFMGMGEPLDNIDTVMRCLEILVSDWGFGWSPKRITVSTIGVLPALRRFLEESRCHLAISLHNPFPAERESMMPVEKAFPVSETIELLKRYDFSGQRRVSFEYTMFAGVNDSGRHCNALMAMLSGLECRINLIRFHKIPGSNLLPSPDVVMERFRDKLNSHGFVCTIRASRGEDIMAACGMLAGKKD